MAKKFLKAEELKDLNEWKPAGTLGNHYMSIKWLSGDSLVVTGYKTCSRCLEGVKKNNSIEINDITKLQGIGYNAGTVWAVWEPKNELIRELRKIKIAKEMVEYVEDLEEYFEGFDDEYQDFGDCPSPNEDRHCGSSVLKILGTPSIAIIYHSQWDRSSCFGGCKRIQKVIVKKACNRSLQAKELREIFKIYKGITPSRNQNVEHFFKEAFEASAEDNK